MTNPVRHRNSFLSGVLVRASLVTVYMCHRRYWSALALIPQPWHPIRCHHLILVLQMGNRSRIGRGITNLEKVWNQDRICVASQGGAPRNPPQAATEVTKDDKL